MIKALLLLVDIAKLFVCIIMAVSMLAAIFAALGVAIYFIISNG